jgi:hypothetical protein
MSNYTFYEIKSFDSLKVVRGLRKRSFVCSGHASIKCFLWIDDSHRMRHAQLTFNNKFIEWRESEGIFTSHQSNFAQAGNSDFYERVTPKKENKIYIEGKQLLVDAEFPGNVKNALLSCFQRFHGEIKSNLPENNHSDDDEGLHWLVQQLPFAVFYMIAASDGFVDEKEASIFDLYLSNQCPIESDVGKLLFQELRKDQATVTKTHQIIKELDIKHLIGVIEKACKLINQSLGKDKSEQLKKDLFTMAVVIAKSSGGFLGISKISKDEQDQLTVLFNLFQLKSDSMELSKKEP